MKAVPLELKQAQDYIHKYHRHHEPAHRDEFRIGCAEDGEIIGVIQVGRPVNRYLDDGYTLEVLRLCSNGKKNVCSFLYSKAARIAMEMGYKRIITYILESETGTRPKGSRMAFRCFRCWWWKLERPIKAKRNFGTAIESIRGT